MLMMSIRDSVSGTYGRPFFETTEATGVRSVSMEVNHVEPSNVLAQNPGDFELFVLGAFDDVTGRFSLLDVPRSVCNLSALVRHEAR